jgi:hypothetical protein
LTIGHPTALDDAHFGWDVCSAGDLNADGRADLFLGAYNQSASAASQGAGFLYYGTPLGITSRPDRTLVDPAAPDDAYFGSAAESAGDLNADGYGDLVVGAYRWAGSMVSQEQGRVYVFLGGPAVIDWPPATTLDDPDTYPGNLFGCDVF